ncbi:MAG: DUF1150 family protein [Micropepsaceae bacterium]
MQSKTNQTGNSQEQGMNVLSQQFAQNLVYIREVHASDLKSAGVIPQDMQVNPLQRFFTLCASDGRRLAVMDSRDLAFAAAREHELVPVSVH